MERTLLDGDRQTLYGHGIGRMSLRYNVEAELHMHVLVVAAQKNRQIAVAH
jgi:hypothetical protein